MSDLEYLLKHAPVEYDVTCARCGKVLSCRIAYIEEGGEWECPACWERCEAEEMAVTVKSTTHSMTP